jgi:transposase-like protein
VFKDTIFEQSRTGLLKWFRTINDLVIARKGVPANQLQHKRGVTLKTSWRILQQIRIAMGNEEDREAFSGTVETDETYVGGKGQRYPKSRSTGLYLTKAERKRGRGTAKPVVMGIKERSSGNVYTQIMPFEASVKGKDKRLSGPQLKVVIDKTCEPGITVMTDDFKGYGALDKKPRVEIWLLDDEEHPTPYVHHTVNHKAGRFSSDAGPGIHTNGIESHWALFKRGFHGTYHSISDKYLLRYLDEFSFRQNTRKQPSLEVFNLLLKRCIIKPP